VSLEKVLGGQYETAPELGVCSSSFLFFIISMNSNHSSFYNLIVHKIAQVRKSLNLLQWRNRHCNRITFCFLNEQLLSPKRMDNMDFFFFFKQHNFY
jgi:hypothetical protein